MTFDIYLFMSSGIIDIVTNWVISVISTLGYPGVGLLMAIQTMAIPVPSEIILPFAGFLVADGKFNLFVLSFVGALGSVVGSSVAYYIGKKGGRPLVQKYGRMVFISERDLEITERFFTRFGAAAAFFGQLLPVVRSFISFPAGISKFNYWKYITFVFIGSFIWCLALGYVGSKLGANWHTVREHMKPFDNAIIVLIAIGAAWWIYRHFRNRQKA